MISLSGRHALPAAIALWLGVVPVAYHGIARPTADDCADPSALALTRFLPRAQGVVARAVVPEGGGAPKHGTLATRLDWRSNPLWTVARTHDLGQSYFIPPGHFSLSSPEEESWIVIREVDGVSLPIHVRVEEFGRFANTAAHLYVFDGRPIRTPVLASLGSAFTQLVGGTLPLTAIVAEGDSRITATREHEAALVDWLVSAWTVYDEVCRP